MWAVLHLSPYWSSTRLRVLSSSRSWNWSGHHALAVVMIVLAVKSGFGHHVFVSGIDRFGRAYANFVLMWSEAQLMHLPGSIRSIEESPDTHVISNLKLHYPNGEAI
jgi:hypothetical protein